MSKNDTNNHLDQDFDWIGPTVYVDDEEVQQPIKKTYHTICPRVKLNNGKYVAIAFSYYAEEHGVDVRIIEWNHKPEHKNYGIRKVITKDSKVEK